MYPLLYADYAEINHHHWQTEQFFLSNSRWPNWPILFFDARWGLIVRFHWCDRLATHV